MNQLITYFPFPLRSRKIQKIQYSDIIYLEGKINYTLIYLINGKVKLSPRTLLYHINNSLDDSFVRIHRAFCVNVSFVEACTEFPKSAFIVLKGGKRLNVSRRKKKNLSQIPTYVSQSHL